MSFCRLSFSSSSSAIRALADFMYSVITAILVSTALSSSFIFVVVLFNIILDALHIPLGKCAALGRVCIVWLVNRHRYPALEPRPDRMIVAADDKADGEV